MSALLPITDIRQRKWDVRKVPTGDIAAKAARAALRIAALGINSVSATQGSLSQSDVDLPASTAGADISK